MAQGNCFWNVSFINVLQLFLENGCEMFYAKTFAKVVLETFVEGLPRNFFKTLTEDISNTFERKGLENIL